MLGVGIRRRGGGGQGSVSGGVITTMTIANTSSSPVPVNFITQMFGHVFKKGDIPSGQYPKFTLSDGITLCPITIWGQVYWSDGSLKFASFLMRVPLSIPANGSLTLNIYSTSTAPAASGRTTADLTAQNLQITAVGTGTDNLTGTWVSSLNTGISGNPETPEVYTIADGQAGKVWRIRAPFMQSGAAHGQFECYWYVAALQDASNGLYGIRNLPKIAQPWYNYDTPAKILRGFTTSFTNNGSTTGLTQPSTGVAQSCTVTNGSASITATNHGFRTGYPVQFTGSAPGGFSLGTTYYVGFGDVNTFTLALVSTGSSHVTATSSGTFTITPHQEVVHFGAFYCANTDGTWQYLQGGGSVAADATVQVQFNKTYWRSTRMVPPYNLTLTPNSYTVGANSGFSTTYRPCGNNILRAYFDDVGEDGTIGIQTSWCATHFLTQANSDLSCVRVGGLTIAHTALMLRDHSTLTIPVLNNTTYTGMGAPANIRWNMDGSQSSGFTLPTGSLYGPLQAGDTSHWPGCTYYAYLVTGEPQFLDNLIDCGNFAALHRYSRTVTVGTTTYYGVCVQDGSQAREDAWGLREQACAAAMCPATYWENANVSTYLKDMMKSSYDAENAYDTAQNAFWQNNGIYFFGSGNGWSPWQHAYLITAVAMATAITEYSGEQTQLNHLTKCPVAVDNDVGIYHWTSYYDLMRTSDVSFAPLVTSMSQIFYWFPSWSTSGTTLSLGAYDYTLTNGDQLMWFGGTPPPGASEFVTYYAINVSDPGELSAKTCNLTTTYPGGTAINLGTASYSTPLGLRMQVIPAAGAGLSGGGSPAGYPALLLAALDYAMAVGTTTNLTTVQGKVATIVSNGGTTYTSEPKYALTTSF